VKETYNLVRALTHPYVGAHIVYKNNEIKIWKIEESKYDKVNIEPGKILNISKNGEILVKTYDNAIRIIKHEFIELPKNGEYL